MNGTVKAVGGLSQLSWFNMLGNLVNGSIPDSFCRMSGLTYLDLAGVDEFGSSVWACSTARSRTAWATCSTWTS